jgi:early secretory antigenic target protein ESAT-6
MVDMQVNFSGMDAGSQQITAAARNVQQELDDLANFLKPLVATWTGQAAELYQSKKAQWDQSAADLFMILNQIGNAVGVANQNYQAAENANKATWT